MPVLESETIAKITELLVQAAKPRRIILFGSHARGDAGADSDIDLMVVERAVTDRIAEMVRLRRALLPLEVAVDLLVVAEDKFNYWQDTPGNIYSEAATEGRVLYEEAWNAGGQPDLRSHFSRAIAQSTSDDSSTSEIVRHFAND
jgi:predicted nucleotidyltransferase